MRHGSGDRAEADPLDHAQLLGECDHVFGERAPAVVGLVARQHQEVAPAQAPPAQGDLGPCQLRRPAVNDLEYRPPGAVVEQQVVVEGGHDLSTFGQQAARRRGGRARVHPAVEGDDGGR